jgi:hypothetical protein
MFKIFNKMPIHILASVGLASSSSGKNACLASTRPRVQTHCHQKEKTKTKNILTSVK